ncbi:hypothetical protein HPP92_000535 [Vanilla planifolia]|uniref:Uncharacterized protein n=1 Tax=Vanilla planifolia TaxID=51239 RepID=A0A835SAW9_VANPL|nr:hypothetical protein HPP92_000535 [Vanilla planifolia]
MKLCADCSSKSNFALESLVCNPFSTLKGPNFSIIHQSASFLPEKLGLTSGSQSPFRRFITMEQRQLNLQLGDATIFFLPIEPISGSI